MALSIPKLQRWGCRSLEMDEKFIPTLYWACDYLSMLGLKLIYVSKAGPRYLDIVSNNWSRYSCALTTILLYDLQQRYIKQSVNVNSLDDKTSFIQAFRIAARHHIVLWRTGFNRNRSFNITPEFKVFAAISVGSGLRPHLFLFIKWHKIVVYQREIY